MGKAKKWVVCLGYSGRGYYGMQTQRRNNKVIDDLPTIESEIFKALLNLKLINENEYHNPSLMYFQRAARTDKGVSALKQIISLNSCDNFNELIPKINEQLPERIQMFGAKRATKYFDSKNFCDYRTYNYLMPSFTIDQQIKHNDNDNDQEFYCKYRLPSDKDDLIDKFNKILNEFIGTHNFHNFTSQKKPLDPSAKRYIVSFECSKPFLLKNSNENSSEQPLIEVVNVRIKGQSFMLHQIRKMIGLSIAIMQGYVDESIIKKTFTINRFDIPIAPANGLLLEEVHYEQYNKKYGGDGIHCPLEWSEYNDSIYKFKHKFIYQDIYETEINELSMIKWLQTLPLHTFGQRDHERLSNDKRINDENGIVETTETDENQSKKIKIE